VYHRFVTHMVRKQFERINQHDIDGLIKPQAPRVEFTMAGEHALSGTRHSRETQRKWFERLFRLFPDLHFEIRSVAVSGGPRNTVVMVEWTERSKLPDGGAYVNDGVHVIGLQNGKVVRTNVYLDTVKLNAVMQELAAQGVEEAAAPPIVD
jgi:ketosteroid isomerase-like protein